MSEVTQGQFFEAFQQLHNKIDHNQTALLTRIDDLDGKLEAHEEKDQLVADRVLIIEQGRLAESAHRAEAVQAVQKRTTLVATGITVLVTATVKVVEFLMKSHP